MTGILNGRLFRAGAVAALAAIMLVLVYLGTRGQPATPIFPPEKLSIALLLQPHSALVYIAATKGYFTEQGLDVSILPMRYGVGAVGQVLQGKADLALAADVPFVIAVMKGEALGMVANLVSVSNDNAIIARRDHGIATARDLPGKKIGATLGSTSAYFLWAYLIRNKLPPDSIKLVDLQSDQIVGALAGGDVDAVVTRPPISLEAQAALGENALAFTEGEVYRTAMTVVGRSEFLKRHPGAIERLVRAMLQAEQFMRSHPDETLTLIAAWLKTDTASLRPRWQQFEFRINLLQSQLNTLEDEARWAMAAGYAPQGPMPNFLSHLYLDALRAVQAERVTVLH